MGTQQVISQLGAVEVRRPSDLIIQQIRRLISTGVLKQGDRLPSERELVDRFRVGRGHVREALRKLGFYGIIQTFPQSGTVVTSLGATALERLISNLLDLDRDDVTALNETRAVLEVHAAEKAAEKASGEAIAEIGAALDSFRAEVEAGREGLEQDLLFHIEIANAARNPVMVSILGLIAPDIIRINQSTRSCEAGRPTVALGEHERIFAAITAGDARAAGQAMAEHMRMTRRQNEPATVLKAPSSRPISPSVGKSGKPLKSTL